MNIIQDWLLQLTLRYQGCILVALRGCDLAAKNDSAKTINRFIRQACLHPYDKREVTIPNSFFYVDRHVWRTQAEVFLSNLDSYPLHYVMHMVHAMEIIGYYHPDAWWRDTAKCFYLNICNKLHLNPETIQQLRTRLEADRVADNTAGQ